MNYLNYVFYGSIILNFLLLYYCIKMFRKLKEIQFKANRDMEENNIELYTDIELVDNSFTLFGDGKEYHAYILDFTEIDEIFAEGRKRDAERMAKSAECYERNKLENRKKNDRSKRKKDKP